MEFWKDKRKRIVVIVGLAVALFVVAGITLALHQRNQAAQAELSAKGAAQEETSEKDSKESESIPGISQLDVASLVEKEEMVYATDQVNIRVAPDKTSEVYQVAQVKDVFTREAYDDTWSLVVIEGTSYFIASEYLTTDLEALEQQIKEAEEAKSQAMSGTAGTGICYNMSAAHIVAIDAGHQLRGNSEKEPNAPGSSTMKAKVTGGTTGTTSGLTEYQLNLNVALKLRDVLLSRGYGVVMIRETNDVNISNVERAQIAQNAGADILDRIHANGADDSSANGIMTICMTSGNPYNGNLYSASRSLSDKILSQASAATGARAQSVWETDTMTGINWATMPVSIIEMGYMTNPTEDSNLATDGYQQNMANGIANGIDQYFQ